MHIVYVPHTCAHFRFDIVYVILIQECNLCLFRIDFVCINLLLYGVLHIIIIVFIAYYNLFYHECSKLAYL